MDFNWNKALNGEYGDFVKECTESCKGIAEDIERYINGQVWIDDDGNTMDAVEDQEPQDGWRVAGLWDYLDDNMGVWTTLDYSGEVAAVRVLVAFGGPNIYIDTNTRAVELYWGATETCYPLTYDAWNAVDDWGDMYFRDCVLPKLQGARY